MKTLGKSRQGVGEGNTETSPTKKQPSRKTFYCFTLHNYENIYEEAIRQLQSISKKGIVGKEICPTSGKKHLQGFIALNKPMRITELKISCNPHWEASIASEESNIKYCSKDGDFIKWGYPEKYTVEIEKFQDWQLEIIDIINQTPDSRSIYWFWEEKGGIGKTTFQKYIYTHYSDTIVCGGKSSDMKHCVVDYFNTNKRLPKIILMNLPKTQELNYFSYTGVEEVKDMFFYSGKYEGGMVCGKNPHLLVFANEPPHKSNMALDRWQVKYIGTITFQET